MLTFIYGCVAGGGAVILVYHYGVVRAIRREFDALRHDVDLLRDKVKISRLV